jgi:hypothetical protein
MGYAANAGGLVKPKGSVSALIETEQAKSLSPPRRLRSGEHQPQLQSTSCHVNGLDDDPAVNAFKSS